MGKDDISVRGTNAPKYYPSKDSQQTGKLQTREVTGNYSNPKLSLLIISLLSIVCLGLTITGCLICSHVIHTPPLWTGILLTTIGGIGLLSIGPAAFFHARIHN